MSKTALYYFLSRRVSKRAFWEEDALQSRQWMIFSATEAIAIDQKKHF